ncbi:MAG: hypothetical protein PWR07_1118, partial [Bacillota bacterium]|nr:hypothetical protein [Bacillota bacterium]
CQTGQILRSKTGNSPSTAVSTTIRWAFWSRLLGQFLRRSERLYDTLLLTPSISLQRPARLQLIGFTRLTLAGLTFCISPCFPKVLLCSRFNLLARHPIFATGGMPRECGKEIANLLAFMCAGGYNGLKPDLFRSFLYTRGRPRARGAIRREKCAGVQRVI